MQIELKGRKAIVTGSTAGIGRAIAEGLARAGASVVVNGRTKERVDTVLREMRALLPQAELSGVAADVATPEGCAALIAHTSNADILINNAGTARPNNFFDQTDQEWLDLFQLNVLSGVRLARHYVPKMVASGWGRVVFISSESALNIPKEMIDYGVTKTALLAVSRGLAELVAGNGVTVNAVLPGPTDSEILSNWMKSTAQEHGITPAQAEQDFLKTMRPTTLIHRFATTEEVANMVVYVASEQASATTAACGGLNQSILRVHFYGSASYIGICSQAAWSQALPFLSSITVSNRLSIDLSVSPTIPTTGLSARSCSKRSLYRSKRYG